MVHARTATRARRTAPRSHVGKSFDVSAAVTNLFTMHNRMHDLSYLLGFTEENWNAQESNFGLDRGVPRERPGHRRRAGRRGAAAAGVYADARNNANMSTLPDGSSSITNMYLWQPVAGAFYPPCVDGDFDAGVIGHEYTHMIENRMIGKGDRRAGFHAGAMGEAVGDLVSIEQLNEYGLVPTGDENPFATGTYATGNKLRGIRNYAANFPSHRRVPDAGRLPAGRPAELQRHRLRRDRARGPRRRRDLGRDQLRAAQGAGREVQRAVPGVRPALQAQCAAGTVPVDQCPGNRRWIQLLFDSFLLMPTNPTMVDARNAILAADQARFGGANQTELWAAFARRGLGRFASRDNGTGRARRRRVRHQPAAGLRGDRPGATRRVTFAATSRRTRRAGGRRRGSTSATTRRASPRSPTPTRPRTRRPRRRANNLDATAAFAPGTYEFIATAPGYGAVRFRRTFAAGGDQTVTLQMAPNCASKTQGATATGRRGAGDERPDAGAAGRRRSSRT